MATNTNVAAAVGDGSILRFAIGTVTTAPVTTTATTTSDLGLVQTISPSISHEPVDVTALDSGGIKQYIGGLRDATLTFDVELDSENDHHNDMVIAAATGQLKLFSIMPRNSGVSGTNIPGSGVVYSGSAYVTDASMALPTGDKQTMSVTLQVTGGMETNAV